jgi:PAT family acetyl-CoA transporter-like MFS transporter 1
LPLCQSTDRRNKYFRSQPIDAGLITLGGYMRFWGVVFVLFTVWLAVVKREDAVSEDDPDMDVKKVYKVMWSIVRLKSESILAMVVTMSWRSRSY